MPNIRGNGIACIYFLFLYSQKSPKSQKGKNKLSPKAQSKMQDCRILLHAPNTITDTPNNCVQFPFCPSVKLIQINQFVRGLIRVISRY